MDVKLTNEVIDHLQDALEKLKRNNSNEMLAIKLVISAQCQILMNQTELSEQLTEIYEKLPFKSSLKLDYLLK